MIMEKERIVYFSEHENSTKGFGKVDKIELSLFSPGKIYRMGIPSDVHYRHIYPNIDCNILDTTEMEHLNLIQGSIITVTSIIRMVNGKRIAVLRHFEERPFLDRFDKIFADVDMAVASREIIPVDLETELLLRSPAKMESYP